MKTILLCASFLMLTTVAHAKSVNCTVTSIQGKEVQLQCKDKKKSLKVGQKVRVKIKGIEGC